MKPVIRLTHVRYPAKKDKTIKDLSVKNKELILGLKRCVVRLTKFKEGSLQRLIGIESKKNSISTESKKDSVQNVVTETKSKKNSNGKIIKDAKIESRGRSRISKTDSNDSKTVQKVIASRKRKISDSLSNNEASRPKRQRINVENKTSTNTETKQKVNKKTSPKNKNAIYFRLPENDKLKKLRESSPVKNKFMNIKIDKPMSSSKSPSPVKSSSPIKINSPVKSSTPLKSSRVKPSPVKPSRTIFVLDEKVLAKKYSPRFFKCFVKMPRIRTEETETIPKKKKGAKKTVSFVENVRIFGESDYEDYDDEVNDLDESEQMEQEHDNDERQSPIRTLSERCSTPIREANKIDNSDTNDDVSENILTSLSPSLPKEDEVKLVENKNQDISENIPEKLPSISSEEDEVELVENTNQSITENIPEKLPPNSSEDDEVELVKNTNTNMSENIPEEKSPPNSPGDDEIELVTNSNPNMSENIPEENLPPNSSGDDEVELVVNSNPSMSEKLLLNSSEDDNQMESEDVPPEEIVSITVVSSRDRFNENETIPTLSEEGDESNAEKSKENSTESFTTADENVEDEPIIENKAEENIVASITLEDDVLEKDEELHDKSPEESINGNASSNENEDESREGNTTVLDHEDSSKTNDSPVREDRSSPEIINLDFNSDNIEKANEDDDQEADIREDDSQGDGFQGDNVQANDEEDDVREDDVRADDEEDDVRADDGKDDGENDVPADDEEDDVRADDGENDVREDDGRENVVREDDVGEDDVRENDVREDDIRENDVQEDDVREDDAREDDFQGDNIREDNFQVDDFRGDDFREDDFREDHVRETDVRETDCNAEPLKNNSINHDDLIYLNDSDTKLDKRKESFSSITVDISENVNIINISEQSSITYNGEKNDNENNYEKLFGSEFDSIRQNCQNNYKNHDTSNDPSISSVNEDVGENDEDLNTAGYVRAYERQLSFDGLEVQRGKMTSISDAIINNDAIISSPQIAEDDDSNSLLNPSSSNIQKSIILESQDSENLEELKLSGSDENDDLPDISEIDKALNMDPNGLDDTDNNKEDSSKTSGTSTFSFSFFKSIKNKIFPDSSDKTTSDQRSTSTDKFNDIGDNILDLLNINDDELLGTNLNDVNLVNTKPDSLLDDDLLCGTEFSISK